LGTRCDELFVEWGVITSPRKDLFAFFLALAVLVRAGTGGRGLGPLVGGVAFGLGLARGRQGAGAGRVEHGVRIAVESDRDHGVPGVVPLDLGAGELVLELLGAQGVQELLTSALARGGLGLDLGVHFALGSGGLALAVGLAQGRRSGGAVAGAAHLVVALLLTAALGADEPGGLLLRSLLFVAVAAQGLVAPLPVPASAGLRCLAGCGLFLAEERSGTGLAKAVLLAPDSRKRGDLRLALGASAGERCHFGSGDRLGDRLGRGFGRRLHEVERRALLRGGRCLELGDLRLVHEGEVIVEGGRGGSGGGGGRGVCLCLRHVFSPLETRRGASLRVGDGGAVPLFPELTGRIVRPVGSGLIGRVPDELMRLKAARFPLLLPLILRIADRGLIACSGFTPSVKGCF